MKPDLSLKDDGVLATRSYDMPIVILSLLSIGATFTVATLPISLWAKGLGFSLVTAGFLGISFAYWRQKSRQNLLMDKAWQAAVRERKVERGLESLDELNRFMSGSLSSADAFLMVSSRVHEFFPAETVALYHVNNNRTGITLAFSDSPKNDEASRASRNHTAAEVAYKTKEIEFENKGGPSVAVPLCRDSEVFAVLHIGLQDDGGQIDRSVIEAVGSRISPIVLRSIAADRSRDNALTDFLTELPNERAFYYVLENQIAECVRKCGERPLSVLAIDIKNFDEINRDFGHAAGDRVLDFTARVIKENLRQMDFVARAQADEFLAVLPTADEDIASDISGRIHTAFFGQPVLVNEAKPIEVEVNIGSAVFGCDGETAWHLLAAARERKLQPKFVNASNVSWFPHRTAI